MTDIVFIQGLRIDGLIGVHAHERTARRPLVFDIELRVDTRVAAASDRLADALDYHAVSMRLVEFVGSSDFQLVETLAEACVEADQEMFASFKTEDFKEGVAHFVEKRAPRFVGR